MRRATRCLPFGALLACHHDAPRLDWHRPAMVLVPMVQAQQLVHLGEHAQHHLRGPDVVTFGRGLPMRAMDGLEPVELQLEEVAGTSVPLCPQTTVQRLEGAGRTGIPELL